MNAHFQIISGLLQKTEPLSEDEKDMMRKAFSEADPIVASAQIITALQTIVSRRIALTENPAVVTVGMIRGGVRSNIIPEEVEMQGTMRALHPDDRLAMIGHMHEIIDEAAAHHTPDFYIDDSRLNPGVKAFVAMTLDYFNNR